MAAEVTCVHKSWTKEALQLYERRLAPSVESQLATSTRNAILHQVAKVTARQHGQGERLGRRFGGRGQRGRELGIL